MKPQLGILMMLCFSIVCGGQSYLSPKLHLTNENLQSFETVEQNPQALEKGKKPSETYLNFNPVIPFIKPNETITIKKDLGDLSQVTIFTVYQSGVVSQDSDLWGIYNEESNITLTTSDIAYSDRVLNYEGKIEKIPILHTYIHAFRSKNGGAENDEPRVLIGSFSGNPSKAFEGHMAELMVFDRVLKGKKRQVVETYLALKYGITLDNTKDYLSSDKDAIYSLEENAGYTKRIFGIGRDDQTGLYQKQSHSTDESSMITIGAGSIEMSNSTNGEKLGDGNFLVVGDNDLEPVFFGGDQSMTSIPLMARHWKMQVTGQEASGIKTTVQLDASTILNASKQKARDYLLVIDSSGEGTFLLENTKYVEASDVKNDQFSFRNLQWDTDRSGTDVFTFGFKHDLHVVLSEAKAIGCQDGETGTLLYEAKGGIPPYNFEFLTSDTVADKWNSREAKYPERQIQNLKNGTYVLRVTDAEGSQTEARYNLERPTPISINLGEARQFQLDEKEIVLDATMVSNEDFTYKWSSDRGFYSHSPKITVTAPGLYTVTVTSSNGCQATAHIAVKASLVQSFRVYPNQSKDGNYQVQVKLQSKQNIDIGVYDMTGRLLYTMQGLDKADYNLTGIPILSAGTYNVVLQSEALRISRKLVID